jgi:hypothetical protein
MKAVISDRIYLSLETDSQVSKIDEELTYRIPTYNPLDPPTIIKNMGRLKPLLVTIPSGRVDLYQNGYESSRQKN